MSLFIAPIIELPKVSPGAREAMRMAMYRADNAIQDRYCLMRRDIKQASDSIITDQVESLVGVEKIKNWDLVEISAYVKVKPKLTLNHLSERPRRTVPSFIKKTGPGLPHPNKK